MATGPMRIGITCNYEVITGKRGLPLPRHVLSHELVQAVATAGGLPLLLAHPSQVDTGHNEAIFALLDGLIISGGDFDIPPERFGQLPHAKLGRTFAERTDFEDALIQGARKRNMPLLGLCGGMQLLNVVYGGSLYQDLSLRPGTTCHEQPHDPHLPAHSLEVAEGSLLMSLLNDKNCEVNSTHHQLVDRVGQGLVASGWGADGAIEAIEDPQAAFTLGVQWHPELLDGCHSRIFRGLVEAAARSAGGRRSP